MTPQVTFLAVGLLISAAIGIWNWRAGFVALALTAVLLLFGVTAGKAEAASGPLSKGAYCYPTSTYWQKQLSNPWNAIYYATHTQYSVTYGPSSHYCI